MRVEKNLKWRENASPRLSVLIIGHRSVELLRRALSSLLRHSPNKDWELLLVCNGEQPELADFASELLSAERMPLCVVRVTECRPGAARNAGVRHARSPLLFFLDDDIECFQDVVSAAIELFASHELQAAGGANLTPPASNPLARATGGLMASRLCAAGMSRRYRISREGPASEHGLILCNLVVRRAVFENEHGFASHLISNEENVLLQRLSARRALLWSSPRLAVYHHRREHWRGLLSQCAKYGAGRAQNLLLLPETFRAFYFLPLLLLAYIAALPGLLLLTGVTAALPLAAYIGAAFAHGLALSLRERDAAHWLSIFLLPSIHLAYGWGFLTALVVWSRRQQQLAEHLA